ncbi:fungal-specific transcription factor domain-containing protein [Xylariales sp. AK1849]|nr:fungal-specific transcription factor domain-containing protein [Xylariales sp. AK1849]
MDLLENQVSDLKYLTQNAITPLAESHSGFTPQSLASPVSAVGHNSAHQQRPQLQQQQASSSITGDHNASLSGNTSNAEKRKSVDDSPGGNSKQQRSKRNRYISIACNECKRRKIKCNGETPCQRCGNLNLQCLYAPNCCSNSVKDSEEFKDMASTVSRLQEQVESLFSNLNALRSETLRLAPIQDRVPPLPSAGSSGTPSSSTSHNRHDLVHLRQSGFRGPTSTHFSLDVAKNTLHKMGYSNLGEDASEQDVQAHDGTPTSPTPAPLGGEPQQKALPDPLWEFDKGEMIRLCRVYEEEVGIMYPVIRVETVVNHARILASWMESAKNNFLVPPTAQDNGISDHKTILLKLVMCCALIVEEHGDSDKAIRLFESVRPILDRMLMSDRSEVANLPLLCLLAGYRFLANDEVLSWRVIGQVVRHCIELGLHRRDAVMRIPDEEDRRTAIHSFWSAYVLERRWSFGTGFPFALSDDEIDPSLPFPDQHPYLIAMITFSQLSARVWRLVRQFEPNMAMDLRQGDIEDLDRQIKQWYRQVPSEVQLDLPDWETMPRHLQPPVYSQKEYNIQRLQIWTYLRLNQIRTWLHIPILHTHSSIMENVRGAERAVKLAKNTIKYLSHLNSTTNVYRKIQVFYHQFLTSAIAVLFLASCHAPVNFSASCREEFYMALELVRDLSSKSWVSQRLWRTIKNLKEVAPRLGLAEVEDLHSSAALTMAGLATGNMGPTPPATTSPFQRPMSGTVSGGMTPVVDPGAQNGWQISTEMSRIFEGYLGMNGLSSTLPDDMGMGVDPNQPDLQQSVHEDDGGASTGPFGIRVSGPGNTSGSVYSQFRDMF